MWIARCCGSAGREIGNGRSHIKPVMYNLDSQTGIRSTVQGPPSSQSRGFEVHILESSHGWLATTVVSYCPSRTSELQPTVITNRLAKNNVLWVLFCLFILRRQ